MAQGGKEGADGRLGNEAEGARGYSYGLRPLDNSG